MSGPVAPSDVIEIRGIRGFGRHGVFDPWLQCPALALVAELVDALG